MNVEATVEYRSAWWVRYAAAALAWAGAACWAERLWLRFTEYRVTAPPLLRSPWRGFR